MAIENAKILNVRIKNKYDSYENWAASGLVLEAGEIAIAHTTVDVKVDNGTVKHPALLMKVGDGEKTFANLPWLSAKAADVLSVCKNETELTAFVNGVIADAGIASSSAMNALAGRVTTAEGEIDALQADLNTAETGLKARVTTAEGAIDALEALVGEKNVATQINEAIAALNLENTYELKGEAAKVQTALNEYKTSNDAAVQKNASDIAGEIARAKAAEEANAGAITAIKDGTTIDSFKDVEEALAGKQATGDYATKTEAQGYANAKDAAIAEAKKAGTDAAAAAAAAQADVDALELLVGDTKVSEQISGAISDLDLANTYAAKVHTHVKADITDFAHTHEIADVNGLQAALDGKQAQGDYATKAEAQGYADAKDEAIEAAQAAADKAQEEVDALETYVGTIPADEKYADITNVIGYINKKAEETLASAQGGSSETAASVKAALDTYKAENDPKVQANTDDIAALETKVGDEPVADQISGAVATETAAREAADTALSNRVKAIEDDYLKTADKTALQEQITTNANAIERLTNGVSAEEVDGVNDLIQYVKDHGTEVTGMKADIAANTKAIGDEETRAKGVESGLDTRLQAVESAVGETGSVATAIDEAVTEAKGYTDAEVKELADGAVATNASDIADLQKQVGDEPVADQITAAIEALKIGDYAKAADLTAAINQHNTDKAALEAAIALKANDADLAAIAKTGNVNDLVQTEGDVLVFDCGTSAV